MSIDIFHNRFAGDVVGIRSKGAGSVLVTAAGDGVVECGESQRVRPLTMPRMLPKLHLQCAGAVTPPASARATRRSRPTACGSALWRVPPSSSSNVACPQPPTSVLESEK